MSFLNKHKAKCILCVLLIVTSHSYLQAQNNAYLFRDSVLMAIPNYSINLIRIDSISKAYSMEIKAWEKSQQQQLNNLLKPYNVGENEQLITIKKRMKAADTAKLALYIKEANLLKKQSKVFDDILKADYAKTIQPILDKVNSTIEAYAKENKIDYVWMMEEIGKQLAYVNIGKNITRAIINRYSLAL